MNLRDIKKDIEYVIGAFIDDCSMFIYVNSGKGNDEVAGLINNAVDLFNELKDKANNPVASDGTSFKDAKSENLLRKEAKHSTNRRSSEYRAFYLSLRQELLEKTDALYAKLSDFVKESATAEEAPAAEKPAAKKPAAKKAPAKKADSEKKPAAKKAPAKKAAAKETAE